MGANLTSHDLRQMVKEVLQEVLANHKAPSRIPQKIELVRITNDIELAKFVSSLIHDLQDPALAQDLRTGSRKFTLQNTESPKNPGAPIGVPVVDGVITEAKIEKYAAGGVVVMGPSAVLTPLARDKARQLGLKIERRQAC
jgi:hypothetical protein